MMITRRESLHRFIRLAALAPLGLAAACMAGQDTVDETEQGLTEAVDGDAEADALAEADTVIDVDPEVARQHFAAMERCLREHGIDRPPGGKFRIRVDGPPPGDEGARGKRVLYRVRGEVSPADRADAKGEVIELDARTRDAMRACAAQVGFPGRPAR